LKLLDQYEVSCKWVVFSGISQRESECKASAELFLAGARESQVEVLKFRDGFMPFHGAEVKDCFERLKRETSPDLVFTHYRDDRHQDHRLISDLTWNTFRDHLVLEYEIPKYDGDVGQPNVLVPLEDGHCQSKIDYLLRSYETQLGKRWFSEDTFRAFLRLRGIEAGDDTSFAEAFYGRKLVL
jgi:LmbE family N-acetylglucosaminyl deacetylase